ncbi:MAG: class D sortase [Firmicutes bacterium]|nr:class D sortase [Bacillota bacterium]
MKIRKIAGGLLVAAGALCMVYAIYINKHVEAQKDELVAQYEDYINWVNDSELNVDEIEDAMSKRRAEEASEIASAQADASAPAQQDKLREMSIPNGIIGIMEIDKIDLVVTMADGTDNKSITLSVGHFPNSAMPGQAGNCAIVGHRSYRYGAYFNRLDELEAGDTVRIKTVDGIFTYCIDTKQVVEPTELSVLDTTDDATITLITCTPIRTATHRLVLKGHLV